jgi:hypothetical protein
MLNSIGTRPRKFKKTYFGFESMHTVVHDLYSTREAFKKAVYSANRMDFEEKGQGLWRLRVPIWQVDRRIGHTNDPYDRVLRHNAEFH